MNTRITLLNTKEKLYDALLPLGHIGTEQEYQTLFEIFEDLEICVGVDQFQNLYKVNNEYLSEDEYLFLDIERYAREECFIEILEDALFFLEADKEDFFMENDIDGLNKVFNQINIISQWLYERKSLDLEFVTALSVNNTLVEENSFESLEDALTKKKSLEKLIKEKYEISKELIDINSSLKDVLSFVNNPMIKSLKNTINTYDICTYFKVKSEAE